MDGSTTPRASNTAPRIPAAALLPWLELDDEALVEALGPLADWMEERSDPRGELIRRSRVVEGDDTLLGLPANLWRVLPGGAAYGQRTAAVIMLARRVRGLLVPACESCHGRGHHYLSYDGTKTEACPDCHGRGWLTSSRLPAV